MASKGKSRRHIKKSVLRILETEFDFGALDYKARTRPGKGKAKLAGVIAASVIYFLGFGAGYFGYSRGVMELEMFAKLVWIMMIPASVVGAVTWMITDSRREYEVRQSLADYVSQLEQGGGRLWRFGPLLSTISIKGVPIDTLVQLSQSGEGEKIDPQDYAETMYRLYHDLMQDKLQLTGDMAQQLEQNLALGDS